MLEIYFPLFLLRSPLFCIMLKSTLQIVFKQSITSKHFRNNQGTDLSGIISHFPKWKTRYTTSHIVFFFNQVTGTFSPFNFWTGKGLSILNHILQVRLLNSMSLRSFISTKTLSAKPENLRGRGDAVNPSTHRAGI